MKLGILEIYDQYKEVGVKYRKITEGKEIELVRKFINYKKVNFNVTDNRNLAIFLETKVGNSYPDIVFVEYNPENYLNWNDTRGNLQKNEYKVLFHINTKVNASTEEIVEQLGSGWKRTITILEKLFDSNLITRVNNRWSISRKEILSDVKIEAVEAKIKNWEQVLQQSIINNNFASESYSLSTVDAIPKNEILRKYQKLGIGIYLENGENFEKIKTARNNMMPSSYQSLIFSELIGKIIHLKEGV